MKVAFGGLALFAVAQIAQAQTPAVVPLPTTALTITGAHAHKYVVEKAISGEEQERGLMYRKFMPANHGMIFPMDPPRPVTFWMKNTYLPLDLVFIGPDRRIISIAANAKPMSEDLIPCDKPVAAVLELNGGAAARAGIKPGDKVAW